MAIILGEKHTTNVPTSEFKINGWVRDTRKAYKQYNNQGPSEISEEQEEQLKSLNSLNKHLDQLLLKLIRTTTINF
jgi:hypothetical protein